MSIHTLNKKGADMETGIRTTLIANQSMEIQFPIAEEFEVRDAKSNQV